MVWCLTKIVQLEFFLPLVDHRLKFQMQLGVTGQLCVSVFHSLMVIMRSMMMGVFFQACVLHSTHIKNGLLVHVHFFFFNFQRSCCLKRKKEKKKITCPSSFRRPLRFQNHLSRVAVFSFGSESMKAFLYPTTGCILCFLCFAVSDRNIKYLDGAFCFASLCYSHKVVQMALLLS